jgi:hypothetical protein
MECKSTQIFDNCKSFDKKNENNSKNSFAAYLGRYFLLNNNYVCTYINLFDYFRLRFYKQKNIYLKSNELYKN